jgi:arylsulfatase A-like enzyme
MTGMHTGHCRTRGNGGPGGPKENVPLAPADMCVAELLKKSGYATGLVGKWGLGEKGSSGIPTSKGFSHFFGYLNQHQAHNYYPDFLWRGEKQIAIANPQSKVENIAEKFNLYAPDLFIDDALQFVTNNKSKPFFLYFATTLPHANNEKARASGEGNEVPSDAPYSNENWPQAEKNKAAMITRLDADVGKLLARIDELGLARDTIVIFTSDNGPHQEGGNKVEFFSSAGPFRGFKRSLTDGGIRVPAIIRWAGTTKPGSVSDLVWAFWDFLPTVCDLAGIETPAGLDGLSIAPTISGVGKQEIHDFLYWEFHESGFAQAIRHGSWKAIRSAPGKALELYDVVRDPAEEHNVAADHEPVVARIETYLKKARTDSKEFPIPAVKKPNKR